jgi:hypothetical protein
MSFRDQVAADIDGVFMNPDEFAETHTINGETVTAVISGNETKKKVGSRNFDGLHGDFTTVSVKKSLLKAIPAQGQNLKLDGKLYKVEKCVDNMGLLTVDLAVYRMGGG